MEKIEVSVCCKADYVDGVIENPMATSAFNARETRKETCFCTQCKQECDIEEIEVVDDIITKDQVDLDLYNEKIQNSL